MNFRFHVLLRGTLLVRKLREYRAIIKTQLQRLKQ